MRRSGWSAELRDTYRRASMGDLEIIRAAVDSLNRGDVDSWVESMHPDVQFKLPPEMPDEVEGTGREAARQSMVRWLEVGDEIRVEIEELKRLDDGRVFLATRVSAKGKGSGVPIGFPRWDLMALRDGMIVHTKIYLDRDQALAAAGLA